MNTLSGGLSSTLITDPAELAPIEDEWRRLAELQSNAFITPEWFWAWWRHRPPRISPVIVVTRRPDGAVAGVMPLMLDLAHRPRMIRFAGAGFGDRFGPAAGKPEEGEVASAAMAALQQAGLDRYTLVLNHVEVGRSWWRAAQRAPATQRAAIVQQTAEQPYISLEGLDWEGYLSQLRSKFRGELRRRERVLRREHEVNLRIADAESVDADLAEFFRLHELRWSERGASSLDAPRVKEAVTDFAYAAQQRGWLRLGLLEVEGAAVAASLSWRIGHSFANYQTGFDPAWSGKAVGRMLVSQMIKQAIEEGAGEFDFLLGAEEYKRRFQNASREVETVVLTKAMAPARLLVATEARARRIGRRMSEHSALGTLTHTLRRRLPTSRSH